MSDRANPNDEIRLGTMLFTMVEPHRGHEVAYNRWYERDHFYSGCMVGRYNFAGDRFVATKRLKALRHPADSPMTPDPTVGSYLALYWVLAGHHDDWNRWSVDNVNWLHSAGRMFAERTHVHTLLYDYAWSMTRDPNGCPIELALDHGYPGLVAVAGDVNDGHTIDEVSDWFRSTWGPKAMTAPWGPDLIAQANPIPLLSDAPGDVPRAPGIERRFLQLHFLEHDPEVGWADGYARLGAELEATGLATHRWTGPFIQTKFGTDAYTDELW
jgi:hypothetical protein